jgi:hypothetical protein
MPRRAAPNGKVVHPDQMAQLRALEAIKWRNAGMTLAEVAARCGYSDSGACFHAIEREAGRMKDHETAKHRRMQAMILDQLMAVYLPRALKGDGWSADRVLKLMERRARMFALDMDRRDELAQMPYQKRIVLEDGPLQLPGPGGTVDAAGDGQVAP